MNEQRDEIDRLIIAAYAIVMVLMLIRYPLLDSFFQSEPWSEIWYTSIQALLMGFVIDDGKPLRLSRDIDILFSSALVTLLIVSFTTFTLVFWILNVSIFTTVILPAMAITFLISWSIGVFLRRRYRKWSEWVIAEQ